MASKLINMKKTAKMLGITYQTLWVWIRKGKFPPPNINKKYSRSYLQKIMEEYDENNKSN